MQTFILNISICRGAIGDEIEEKTLAIIATDCKQVSSSLTAWAVEYTTQAIENDQARTRTTE